MNEAVSLKTCRACKSEYPATPEYFHRNKNSVDGFLHRCKTCLKPETPEEREWRLAVKKQYRNSPEYKEKKRKWNKAQRESLKWIEYARVWKHKRAAWKRNLPDAYTKDDWALALEYFHGCCAVCQRQLNDLFGEHRAAADHWIPLSSPNCPGTTPTNIVPLCHGVDGCNNSKHNHEAMGWLVSKFGKRKANEINARIQAYFDYVGSLKGAI